MSDTIRNWGGKLLDWLGIANVPAALTALASLKGEPGKVIKIGGVDAQGGVTGLVAADEPEGGQNPSQGGSGVTAELKTALKAYFTNVQTLIGQTAYSAPNTVADIVIGNARAVLDALEVQPEQPESGIIQSGGILAITSGVTVTQTGNELTIR